MPRRKNPQPRHRPTSDRPARPNRPTATLLCARIGHAPFVPAGYEVGDCSWCGSPVWLDPDLVAGLAGREVTTLCNVCAFPKLFYEA
jgi:hypothetical protein